MDEQRPVETPRAVSLSQLRWLREQAADWESGHVITGEQRLAILGRYESDEAMEQRGRHRAFVALCGLALLMCAAGVLLLIGYNWDAISRGAKVAMIFAAVVTAFAGSAEMYRRHRNTAGELLGFLGTLMFGAAIWLLAQVYHIEAHYPDGLMWWMVGALAAAWLLRSRVIGVEAVLLLSAWACTEAENFHNPNYLFVPFAGALITLAYRLRSNVLLGLAALSLVQWLFVVAIEPWSFSELVAPVMVLVGCAYYAAGTLHTPESNLGRTWQVIGLAVLLAALMPLTFTEFHRPHGYGYFGGGPRYLAQPGLIATAGLAAFTLIVFAIPSRLRAATDWPILATVLLAVVSMFVLIRGWGTMTDGRASDLSTALAVGFSGLTLVLSVWLILRGIKLDRSLSFFVGVAYMLVFVMVRWFDLIGDMVGSAVLFFVSGGLLFGAAWYWRRRHAMPYRPLKEATHV
jgi:uncharacterized membrane protein